MKSVLNYIDQWGLRIVTFLTIIVFFKTCTTNSRIDVLNDEFVKSHMILNTKIDSHNVILRNEIKIEGLKSEKRMIQSTDRKILDVNRQSEIDKELEILNKK